MVKSGVHGSPTVRMVHVCPPIVVHTDLSSFRTMVQELTGLKKLKPDNDQFNNGTTNHPFMIKSDDTFYEDHINACHSENYDQYINGDCTSKACSSDCINEQMDGPSINDNIYDDCDGLSDASLSPKWATPSSSHESLMSKQQQESLMIWDYEENYRMFVWSANAGAYARESPPLKKLQLEDAGSDNYQLMSNSFMDIFSMEETLGFVGLDHEEHSNHHLLQDHLSVEVSSLISAL